MNAKYNPTGRPTPGYDQITVNCGNGRSNQMLGGGAGLQHPRDVGPNNLTAAHEFGHTLGLGDQYMDTPQGSVPDPDKTWNPKNNIMCQTWPDRGKEPHSYDEHYNSMLSKRGL